MITAWYTPLATASVAERTLGIIPPVMWPSAISPSIWPTVSARIVRPVTCTPGTLLTKISLLASTADGDPRGHVIGVDVVGQAIVAQRDRRNDRGQAQVDELQQRLAVDRADFTHATQAAAVDREGSTRTRPMSTPLSPSASTPPFTSQRTSRVFTTPFSTISTSRRLSSLGRRAAPRPSRSRRRAARAGR